MDALKRHKANQPKTMKVPPQLYELIKREAQARGCFIWKVLDDAVKCYLASGKASK